jgi:hypothetical protein
VFLILPGIARPFYVVWYAVACTIGLVVSNLLLALVYYVVVTGTGLARRILGRHFLDVRLDRSRKTYWRDAGPAPAPRRYYRQS